MADIEKMYDKMFTDYPDVVSVPQLMKMLSVGRHAAYELLLPQLNLATIHKPLKPNRRKMETSLLPTNQKRQSLVGLSIVSSGEIQSFKVGKNIRIPKIKVIEYILGARRCCI